MTDRHILRFGGASGLLFVILFIPSYLSAPNSPVTTSSTQQVIDYFSSKQNEILILNGLLLIVSAFFFLCFLGILHGLLQDAEREGYGFSSVSLAGGVAVHNIGIGGGSDRDCPSSDANSLRKLPTGRSAGLPFACTFWVDVPLRLCWHGCDDSLVALRTGLLPKWLAWVGFVCTVIALLRFLGPLGGWLTLLWIVVVSVLLLAGTVGHPFVATPVPRQ